MKILLISPYPPPLGGVSVFTKRRKRALSAEGHQVDVLDPTKMSAPRYFFKLLLTRFKSYDLISVNVYSPYVSMILYALGLARKVEVIDHNWRQLEHWGKMKRRIYSHVLSRSKELILMGEHLRDYYAAHNVALPERVSVKDSFIPPPPEDEELILKTYPPDLLAFIAQRRPLIIANAPRIVFYKDVDLYALDMCVHLVASLKQEFANVCLLFALAEIGDEEYFAQINRLVDKLSIRENFSFLIGQKELWPLFREADLMVRPTNTDGISVSVAEALYFGCPAVASDAVERPAGTIIFRNRDGEDFLRKCEEALNTGRRTTSF
ncbi:MAG: glycosyltransferase family 4 protein [Pyrinomonadaceae bacterium]